MNYQANLINALELLLYRDRSRTILSSNDEDVLQIFSGDSKSAILGLHDFYTKHQDKAVIIRNTPGTFEVKVFSLFPNPEERIRKEKYVERRQRRYGRW
jgi:hypothetical protein